MTPEQLAAIRERANNATPGLWEADRHQVWGPNGESVAFVSSHDPGEGSGQPEWEANAEFIANARTDVPALLDHVEALMTLLEPCHCNKNPVTTDGPEEDCPQHGRPYSHWVDGVEALTARLAAVRELHTSLKPNSGGEHYLDPVTRRRRCAECVLLYPCPTIRTIERDPDGSQ